MSQAPHASMPPVLTNEQAVSIARALVPRLRERAPRAEELRALPDESIRDLIETGLMRAIQPRRVGGSELDWVCLIDVASELARGCASTAWNWCNYAVHHWMLAFWPVPCQDEIWGADPDVLIASSMVFPAGRAVPAQGGYRLSGRWPFSSGVDPSEWNMLGGMVQAGGEPPEHRMFLVPRESYRIIDNWHVMGLCATGSKDVEVNDLFVPDHRTVAVDVTKGRGDHPGAAVNPSALFRIPIFATFPYMLIGVALGIAQAACEQFLEGVRGRVARYSGKSMADMTAVQMKIAEASACVDTARLIMRQRCQEAQEFAERREMPDLLIKTAWRRDGAFAAGLCERAMDLLFKAGGGAAIFDEHPLQRAFRDLHAATAHISMIWEAQATTFGRVALGLPCDNPTL